MWIYKDKIINSIEDINDSKSIGFIYKITNITLNKIYIGRKNFYTERTKALGKKELALITDKRKSKSKKVKKESDWLVYNSSSLELISDYITGKYEWKKEIIELCYNKKHLTYFELKHQILSDVLVVDSYNKTILGKFFRKDVC